MPKLSVMEVKHRKFVKGVLAGNNLCEAARLAGYKGTSYPQRLMNRADVQRLLLSEMEKAGINDGFLAKRLKDGLNAKTVPRRDGGKRYDDQFVRKQFMDIVLKVRGDYAPEKVETTTKTIQLVIDHKMLEALKDSKALPEKELEELEYLQHEPVIGEGNEEEKEAIEGRGQDGPSSSEEVEEKQIHEEQETVIEGEGRTPGNGEGGME